MSENRNWSRSLAFLACGMVIAAATLPGRAGAESVIREPDQRPATAEPKATEQPVKSRGERLTVTERRVAALEKTIHNLQLEILKLRYKMEKQGDPCEKRFGLCR